YSADRHYKPAAIRQNRARRRFATSRPENVRNPPAIQWPPRNRFRRAQIDLFDKRRENRPRPLRPKSLSLVSVFSLSGRVRDKIRGSHATPRRSARNANRLSI